MSVASPARPSTSRPRHRSSGCSKTASHRTPIFCRPPTEAAVVSCNSTPSTSTPPIRETSSPPRSLATVRAGSPFSAAGPTSSTPWRQAPTSRIGRPTVSCSRMPTRPDFAPQSSQPTRPCSSSVLSFRRPTQASDGSRYRDQPPSASFTAILIGTFDLADEGVMDSPHGHRNAVGSTPGDPRQESVRFPTHFQQSDRAPRATLRDVQNPNTQRRS